MSSLNLKQTGLARLIAAGNAAFNDVLLTNERTSVEGYKVFAHYNNGQPNAELEVVHDTVGTDDTDVPDEVRFERKFIEYVHMEFDATEQAKPYEISVSGSATKAKIVAALNAVHGFKLRVEDLVNEATGGEVDLRFSGECLLYSGSIRVQISAT